MSNATERRALDLFEQWLDLEPNTRKVWLDAEVAHDPVLADAVQRLIAAHSQAEMLPTLPPEPVDTQTFREVPDRIDAWRLVSPIGEGGMGTVYRAERADGLFAQTAAIKLIRPGLFSARSTRQFATEREILAGLQHPHIARLYDGGTSADGLSYFVMELIDGVPITTHCAQQGLSLAERVQLVQQLCDAVSYAHRRLVVHADIKPVNVLVDPAHGVKLLDFGISRLSGEGDEPGMRSGMSPRYASPQQQAGARAVASDDVYALGILLGELCDGFAIDRELQAVIDKARAPATDQRYPAVSALSDDLERWRGGFPVHALPHDRWRSFSAFVGRHRFAAVAGTLATLALAGAAIVSTIMYVRADASRADAERRFGEVRALASYLMFDVDPQLARLSGSLPVRREAAARASQYLEMLSADAKDNPELAIEAARGHMRMAGIYGYDPVGVLNDLPMARKHLQQAKSLLAAPTLLASNGIDVTLARGEYALTLAASHLVEESDESLARATKALGEAEALFTHVTRRKPDNLAADYGKWRAAVYRIRLLFYDGKLDEAITLGRVTAERKHLAPRTSGQIAEHDFLTVAIWTGLAQVQYEKQSYEEALQSYQRAKEEAERIAASQRAGIDIRFMLTVALSGIGDCLTELGQPDRAIDYGKQSLAVLMDIRKDGPNDNVDDEIATTQVGLARQLLARDRTRESVAMLDAAVSYYRDKAEANPTLAAAQRQYAVTLQAQANIYRKAGLISSACQVARDADVQWQRTKRLGGIMAMDNDHKSGVPALVALLDSCRI